MPEKRLAKTRDLYNKWVVSWRWNDAFHYESFETKELALAKMIQLEAFGQKPSLHERME